MNPTTRHLISLSIFVLFWPTLMLFLSGDPLWFECWLFAGWFVLTMGVIASYLYFKDPSLLAERFRKNGSGNQKAWDKYFIVLFRISLICWFIIMPLDAKRFNWSPKFSFSIKLLGLVLMLTASLFLFLSFRDNTFLSPHVRIQAERRHQVITKGVYRIVRHPMYLGLLLIFIGIPLLLNSYLGLTLGIMMTFLLAFRLLREEKMLMDEFEDYAGYKRKVHYRLVPFLW